MGNPQPSILTAGPMTTPDQNGTEVEHCYGQRNKESNGRKTDDSPAEIQEVFKNSPFEKSERCIESDSENKGDCQVGSEERGDHADCKHGQAHEPVTEIS